MTARSHTTYTRTFGGWNDALETAVGEINARKNKQRLTVTCNNPECSNEYERLPSELRDSEYSYCSQECHYEHNSERYAGQQNPVSTLGEVDCRACGKTLLRPRWQRERYERSYCEDCWGDSHVSVECEWCGDITDVWPARVDTARFCGRDCLDEWRSEHQRGKDHPRWRPGRRPGYYGPNWPNQRRETITRDQARCQDCGLTEPESVEKYGAELTVHHKTDLREFVDAGNLDHESANQLDNLVTLCVSCHGQRGGAEK